MKMTRNYLALSLSILPSIVKGTSIAEKGQTVEFEVDNSLEEGEFFLLINLDVKEGKVNQISPCLSESFKNRSMCDALLIYRPDDSSPIAVCFIELKTTSKQEEIKKQIEEAYRLIWKEKRLIQISSNPRFLCLYASQKASPRKQDVQVEIEGKKFSLKPLRKSGRKFKLRQTVLNLLRKSNR